ncbi:hypothetical protein T440DRAFT_501779 [Plenodomus tracheiphilus IPT5]|uniref:Cellulose-binding family II protein n=1 Tax=Plenodomus tracheiphilus IPT5 TaxID=1408161 RepID=A0A6A7ASZ1_9PLEO|nr:hypothetical protein T440DRAFT_501779 [Plenodomus tracheiphilus IPT5]
MKYAFALSALVASTFAGAIPGDVHKHIQRRAADPQPICSFEDHSFNDSNAWDAITPTTSKRDLAKTTWSPPSNLVTPLKQVWDHQIATYSDPLGFKNYGYDQVIAGKGKINYCVRWEGNKKVTAAQRAQVETAIRKQFAKWIAILRNFEGWSYKTVDVNVVGKIDVYTDKDEAGIPQCAESCGRFFNQNGDYSRCAKGAARHYDQSLWLTPGFNGGAGGDWGQRVAQEYFMENISEDNIHIVLHELGHTFALDDFYDWTPTGVTNFVMLAGSAMEITEFDAWMARDWWRNLKAHRGW